MKRRLELSALKSWMDQNDPNADLKLALKSNVSLSLIRKMVQHKFNSSHNQLTMDALCKAMDMPIDQVFPMRKREK